MKKWIIGIDEVGRGPLAGPVYVCAAAMPADGYKKILAKELGKNLTDSKKMTATAREKCFLGVELLKKKGTVRFAVAKRTATAIDAKGISLCIAECIAQCLKKLDLPPKDTIIKLDGGLKAPPAYKHQQTIIKGDLKEKIISLASVIAKVQRDHYMVALSKKHPAYDWHLNKGYGTRSHILALRNKGASTMHRKSFLTRILDI